MNSFENDPNYWVDFWNKNNILNNKDLQKQIGRTINKEPINSDIWTLTIAEIVKTIKLNSKDELVDLCSGNGLLSMPFSKQCKHVTAVDISRKLLDKIDLIQYTNITKVENDLRTVHFENDSFSKAIIYFALQHFSERETILLLKSVYNWLKPNGLFFIGDIPDSDKMFVYFNNIERQNAYFESILSQKPAIGTWFNRLFLEKLATNIGFKKCLIIEQPSFQINSHYRFDILLEK